MSKAKKELMPKVVSQNGSIMRGHRSVVAGWSKSVARKAAEEEEEDMVATNHTTMREEMRMLTNLSDQIATMEEGAVAQDIMTATTEAEEKEAVIVMEVVERGDLTVMEAVTEAVALPTTTTKSMLQIVTIIERLEY
jgi:hypothetical protein